MSSVHQSPCEQGLRYDYPGAPLSLQTYTTQYCKHTLTHKLRIRRKRQSAHTNASMQSRMCTNYSEFTSVKCFIQSIPNQTNTQEYTRRCDLPGRTVKRSYVRKHLAVQTEPHKAATCSLARTRGSAPHISMRGEEGGRGRRRGESGVIRWDQTRNDGRHEKHEQAQE